MLYLLTNLNTILNGNILNSFDNVFEKDFF